MASLEEVLGLVKPKDEINKSVKFENIDEYYTIKIFSDLIDNEFKWHDFGIKFWKIEDAFYHFKSLKKFSPQFEFNIIVHKEYSYIDKGELESKQKTVIENLNC